MAAVEAALAANPRDILALVARGDLYAAAGDARSAGAFYRRSLQLAPAQPPPPVLEALQRAASACRSLAADYRAFLTGELAARGYDPGRSSARFGRAFDIALGDRRVYHQQPKYFLFPELPPIQFYERDAFPWLAGLEAATATIREELLGVLDRPGAFQPYVQGDANRPRKDQLGMLNNPDWSALFLVKNGSTTPEAERFPRTLAALQDVPLAHVPHRSPSVLFSLLRPGAHIPPHHGLVNTRLIGHLPLIVPPGCTFRVGNEVRDWRAGEAWLFDDTIEHEAWNRSAEPRVILIFDVWRPELTLEERGLVTALFDAIDAHAGAPPAWDI